MNVSRIPHLHLSTLLIIGWTAFALLLIVIPGEDGWSVQRAERHGGRLWIARYEKRGRAPFFLAHFSDLTP